MERLWNAGLFAACTLDLLPSWGKIAAFERNTGVLYSFFPLLYSRFSAKKTPFAAGGGQRGFGDQKPTGSKSAAPCLHRGQMKSGGSSSPS